MKAPIWNFLSPRKRKLLFCILGLLLLYTLTGFFILPPIVRAVAVKKISQQLDREVSIQKIKINPFVLSTTVRGLLIKDKDGEPFVSWDEVYVNFQLSSLFNPAWTFKEISTTNPYVRVQLNPDRTFNFSDILARLSTNTAPARSSAKPFVLHVEKLHIVGASASFTDLTMRHPFKRVIGPLDLTLDNFRTSPDNKNPYAFSGTTDAGERFSWRGFFYLDPLRSQGELTLDDITLNKYAPLYQDFVRFEIRDGNIGVHANYRLAMGATNLTLSVTNTAFALRHFKLGVPGDSNNIAELDHFAVTGASVDLQTRQAEVGSILASGGRLNVRRNHDASVNVVELAKPAVTTEQPSGGIVLLLRSVTNAVAMLLNSTNQWSGTVHNVNFTNCALHLEDLVNLRPATLELDDFALEAKNISNLPGTKLTAELSLRWNTNGAIHTAVAASFAPPTADVELTLRNLDLATLDPYLEPKLNLLVLNSRLGLDGQIQLRTPQGQLPDVTFRGDARLDDLHTVDGVTGGDLLKWDSVRVNGIDANLNPQVVSIRQIAVDNAYARVVVETNHSINLLTALRPAETNAFAQTNVAVAAATTTTTNVTTALPKISVGSIVVSNAAVRFTDRSLEPNVNLSIEKAGGTISGISSEEWQRADVNLHALVDNVGPADITGHINPFSGTQTNDVKISVKDVELTPASPYAGKFAGYRIAEGKLNLDLDYNLVGRKLQSKNVITLDRFTFGERVNSPEATHLPVRLAVAILKDREGKIVLDVPIEGSLDDPKFRIGKVVTRAILNILTKVATSPFSLLGALFGGGGEELSYQDFAPGSADLSPGDTNKLNSLIKALYARPGLNLEISGSVEPVSDRDGLRRAALDKELRIRKWQALRKSERANITAEQITFTPEERARLVKQLFDEAQAASKITPEVIAANTNLAAVAAQLIAPRKVSIEKGATILMQGAPTAAPKPSGSAPVVSTASALPPLTDPMETLLLATFPAGEDELATLAADRAKAVRAYILASGKVEAARLFLTETQSGGVRSDGRRAYLQLR
jgi:Domain of Unknown Function (DUF748)